jgi:hypothetical protein
MTIKQDDQDQIDPEHSQQRDHHAVMLASWQACGIIHSG